MIHASVQSENGITLGTLRKTFLEGLKACGERQRVLLIPPDITRYHSLAGTLTCWAVEYYGKAVKTILPALGTHVPMTDQELDTMYPGIDHTLFAVHDWRHDVVTIGTVPAEEINRLSEGKLSYSWSAQVNKRLVSGDYDLVLSLGQVVPHEVIGMANYNKNIFVGTGGSEGINKSHYLGAVYGMERIMGRADSPVRALMDYAQEHFAKNIPLEYALTVVARDKNGAMQPMGLFMGNDRSCYEQAARLSLKVNFTMVDEPLAKVVVYLQPGEFRTTWLGNKSIYRTRMAIADGGELIVLAPGVAHFGEDQEIDRLIRKYGYKGTKRTLEAVSQNDELKNNLSAAAHLIHGSSEGRFTIRYCPGHMTQQEVESVGYQYGDLKQMLARYPVGTLQDGWNTDAAGGRFYYISNPAIGLWAHAGRFYA